MQHLARLPLALSLLTALLAQPLAKRPHNPVLPGDYPDPSVIRVGNEYWATATSSQWAPIFPLLRSTDLIHWQQVGSVFPRRPDWSEENYWAPEIARHNNRIFIYYTARKRGGPLCVAVATADRPQGPYTDHGPMVCQDAGSIDAVPITDENNRRYLVWKEDGNSRKQPTPLWAQPLSEDGTKLIGERVELFRNGAPWEGQLVEGPFLLRRDGWFYVFYSGAGCCGLKCNYALGVARARQLLGPWEKNPANPILDGNAAWKCPGRGSIVADGRGRTWLLYHAYDPQDFVFAGRQGLLDEVTWGADQWPRINAGRGPSARRPHLQSPVIQAEFAATALDQGWQWPRSQEPQLTTEANNFLRLSPGPGARVNALDAAVAARVVTTADYTATTAVDMASLASGTRAGLAAYGNDRNVLGAAVGNEEITLWHRRDGKEETLTTAPVPSGTQRLHLRLTAHGSVYRFACSANGKTWTDLGDTLSGAHLPPWDLAVRVALTASAPARFDYLRIRPSGAANQAAQ